MKEMDTQDWPSRQRSATSQRLMFTFTEKLFTVSNQFSNNLLFERFPQTHTILKQYRNPKGNLLFTPLLSLSKNYMHNKVWCCAEILFAVINMASFLTP